MKKLKSILCVALLSTLLVGNVFADDTVGVGSFSVFDNIVNAVVSMLTGGDECPPRQCTHCRTEQVGGSGDCRADQS